MKEINSGFFKGCPIGTTHVRNNFWHKLDKDKLYTYNTYRNDWNEEHLCDVSWLKWDITFINRYEEHDHLFFG